MKNVKSPTGKKSTGSFLGYFKVFSVFKKTTSAKIRIGGFSQPWCWRDECDVSDQTKDDTSYSGVNT
jgi:hypothetical protein